MGIFMGENESRLEGLCAGQGMAPGSLGAFSRQCIVGSPGDRSGAAGDAQLIPVASDGQ